MSDDELDYGPAGLLVFAPAALAACAILACQGRRRRGTSGRLASNIWPDWMTRPDEAGDETDVMHVAAPAEDFPLLQQPPEGAYPDMLLIVPVGATRVARALTDVGLAVQPLPLVRCVEVRRAVHVLGVWAPAALLEKKAEQTHLPSARRSSSACDASSHHPQHTVHRSAASPATRRGHDPVQRADPASSRAQASRRL